MQGSYFMLGFELGILGQLLDWASYSSKVVCAFRAFFLHGTKEARLNERAVHQHGARKHAVHRHAARQHAAYTILPSP